LFAADDQDVRIDLPDRHRKLVRLDLGLRNHLAAEFHQTVDADFFEFVGDEDLHDAPFGRCRWSLVFGLWSCMSVPRSTIPRPLETKDQRLTTKDELALIPTHAQTIHCTASARTKCS